MRYEAPETAIGSAARGAAFWGSIAGGGKGPLKPDRSRSSPGHKRVYLSKRQGMSLFYLLNILGLFSFAVSGAISGMQKRLDPFGVMIIALVTALGGGTLRDVLIGHTPVGWMQDLNYFYTILCAYLFAIIFREKMNYLRRTLFLFDTVGLGIFTITGVETGMTQQLSPVISLTLGVLSGVFGGVIRDILCNDIPVIFQKEIYATPCLIGGLILLLLEQYHIEGEWTYIITIATVITIRLFAVRYHLHLPPFYRD